MGHACILIARENFINDQEKMRSVQKIYIKR